MAKKHTSIVLDLKFDNDKEVNYVLACDDPSRLEFPDPEIIWKMDDKLFLNYTLSTSSSRQIQMDFYAPKTGREIFSPTEVNPPVLSTFLEEGFNTSILLRTVPFNVSTLATAHSLQLTSKELRSLVLKALIGEWTCEKRNAYGNVSATTIIRECNNYTLWEPLTQQQENELKLEHGPHLLPVAAPSGSSIRVEQTRPTQTVVVHENVKVQFDCLPWLRRFKGGNARWLLQSLFPDQSIKGIFSFVDSTRNNLKRQKELNDSSGRLYVHPNRHTLTLQRAVAREGVQDQDYGIYTCEVCVPSRDGKEEQCYNSSTTLFVAGHPPRILTGNTKENPFQSRTVNGQETHFYHIGSEICIDRDTEVNYALACDDPSGLEFPDPETLWKMNDNIFLNYTSINRSDFSEIQSNFYAPQTGREIFSPTEFNPPVLSTCLGEELNVNILLGTVPFNVSYLSSIYFLRLTSKELQSLVHEAVIGEWTCEKKNAYGNVSATTIIRECDRESINYTLWEPFTQKQEKELKLEHGPHLLPVAAPSGSNIRVEQTRPTQTVVVHENVKVQFDCLPWLRRFKGGKARWLSQSLFPDQSIRGRQNELWQGTRRLLIHPKGHTLTLQSTVLGERFLNPVYRVYTCEVCVAARDKKKEQCYNSSTTIFVAGHPPTIVTGNINESPFQSSIRNGHKTDIYRIGSQICIDRDEEVSYALACDNSFGFEFPNPESVWKMNGHLFLNSSLSRSIQSNFYAPRTGREIFNPSEINPSVLSTFLREGSNISILLTTVPSRVSFRATAHSLQLTSKELRSLVLDAIMGEWTCERKNAYGKVSATTIIRECETDISVKSGRQGNILGGAGVYITNAGQFHSQDIITCQFGTTSVEAQIIGISSAICASPKVSNPSFIPLQIIMNGEVEKEQSFRALSPEITHAVSLSSESDTLLYTSGDHITLRWSPESLVPSDLVNNVTVDISIYHQDSNGNRSNPIAEFTKIDVFQATANDGEASVILKNYVLACSPASGGVTFTVCPIYFKVSVSRDQYLPSDLAIWSGTAYYRSNMVTDLDMVDQCEQWRKVAEESQVSQLLPIQRANPCPPNQRWAIWDFNYQVENRTSALTRDQNYHSTFQHYFHPGTNVCFRRIRINIQQQQDQQCCYGNHGILVKRPTGGSSDFVSPRINYHQHVLNDLVPYVLCCKGETFATCDSYFEARPEGSEVGYFRIRLGWLFGDPHIVTLDGHRYTFNGKGEFILIQTHPQVFSLQGRMEQAINSEGLQAPGTVFTAIVAKQHISNDTVQFQVSSNSTLDVFLNGKEVVFDSVAVLDYGDVILYDKGNSTVQALFRNGTSVEISVRNRIINLISVSLPDSLKSTTSGLMGNFNGLMFDDLQPRNETIFLPLSQGLKNIHNKFGITWIIKDAEESLFTYQANDSWSTFYFPDFIPTFTTTFTNSTLEREAREKCNNDALCLFDVAATERIEIGLTTMEDIQTINLIDEASVRVVCTPPCQNGVCLRNNTCSCNDGYEGERCTKPVIKSCPTNPCQNNGSCSVQGLTFSCSCPPEFEGALCQRKALPFHIQMLNGSPRVNGSRLVIEFRTNRPSKNLCILDFLQFVSCRKEVVDINLTSGTHLFTILSIIENENTQVTRRIFIGACSIHLTNNGASVNGGDVSIEFRGSSDIPQYQCSLDGTVTHSNCTSPLSYSALNSGKHLVHIQPLKCSGATRDSTLPVQFIV